MQNRSTPRTQTVPFRAPAGPRSRRCLGDQIGGCSRISRQSAGHALRSAIPSRRDHLAGHGQLIAELAGLDR
jgi:hypothetical protein